MSPKLSVLSTTYKTRVLAYILLILTYRPMSGRALRNTTAPKSRVTIPTALVMVTIVVFT
jgi:hypothetical protein